MDNWKKIESEADEWLKWYGPTCDSPLESGTYKLIVSLLRGYRARKRDQKKLDAIRTLLQTWPVKHHLPVGESEVEHLISALFNILDNET